MTCVAVCRWLGGATSGIPLSSVIEESHSSTLNITRNPIETGADVVDHAHIEPKSLSLKSVIDQEPSSCRGDVSDFSQSVEGDTSWHRVASTPRAYSRLASAYESLVRLQESRKPFDIVTGLFIYKNMLIESIDTVRDKNNAYILEFTAKCLEVKFASTSSVSSSGGAPPSSVAPDPGKPNNQGQTPGVKVTPENAASIVIQLQRLGLLPQF